jgi:hypothetical protein
MLKLSAAAPTMHLGSHFEASLSSSAKWQILSALVRDVTGAMMPAGFCRQSVLGILKNPSRCLTNQHSRGSARPPILILPLPKYLISARRRTHGK